MRVAIAAKNVPRVYTIRCNSTYSKRYINLLSWGLLDRSPMLSKASLTRPSSFLSLHLAALRSAQFSLAFLLTLLVPAAAFAQKTIHIPADQPTIQAGIDAAAAGDTVLVAPGIYFENIDFKGKAITVLSSGGASKTTLDASLNGTVVTIGTTLGSPSNFDGFTVQHGFPKNTGANYNYGGGINIIGNATVSNNTVTDIQSCGIDVLKGDSTIRNNHILHNIGTPTAGSDCRYFGGGILVHPDVIYGDPVPNVSITGNLIEENADGGIAVYNTANVSIIGNTVRNAGLKPDFYATGVGISLAQMSTFTVVANNLIYGNAGVGLAARIAAFGNYLSLVNIVNNTFYGNGIQSLLGQNASEMELYDSSRTVSVVNNIVFGTSSKVPPMFCNSPVFLGQLPVVDHNDIYSASFTANPACITTPGLNGNRAEDPLFLNRASQDFHLLLSSPEIDSGNNSALLIPAIDFDGNPRIQDATGKLYPIVDIGAYETTGLIDANPTTIVLTPSVLAQSAGIPVVLTARLASPNGIPTGSVTFLEDGLAIGAASIDSSGTAVIHTLGLTPGIHSMVATYAGQSGFTPAVSVVVYIGIGNYTLGITLTSSQNPSALGQPVTFTATTTSPNNTVPAALLLTDNGATLATLTPNSRGIATFTTSSLTAGTHSIIVFLTADAANSPGSAGLNQVVGTTTTTTTTLTSSLNPATLSQPITFTAQVTSPTGTPTGVVDFFEGITNIGVVPLTGTTVTLTTSFLNAGTHTIAAVYVPTGSFAGSSITLNQRITALPTTTSLTVFPSPAFAGQSVTFSSTVTPLGSAAIPTGTVTFYSAANVLGTATLDSAGHATFVTNSLTPGTLSVYALYAGDTTYATSTSTILTENIQPNPTATTVTITPSPGTAYQYVAVSVRVKSLTAVPLSAQPCVPACTVNLNIQGLPASIPAISSLSIPPSGTATTQFALPAGSYTLRATFNGNGTFLSSSATPIPETVLPAPTALTLTVAPNSVYQRAPITFTAGLTANPSIEITSGTITFLDGTTPIGAAPFNANLLAASTPATFSTSALAPGTHSITAMFPGNADFLPTTSTAVLVTINPQDFAIAPASPTLTLQTQHHLTTTLNLTSLGAFADTLSFDCSNLPAYASCKFTPGSLQLLPNGTATASLYLDTSAVIGYASRLTPQQPGRSNSPISLALLLSPAALLLGIATRRQRKTALRLLLLLIALLPVPLAFTGCSGLYPGSTPPGTYTIGITATAASTHINHTAQIKLVVTQ